MTLEEIEQYLTEIKDAIPCKRSLRRRLKERGVNPFEYEKWDNPYKEWKLQGVRVHVQQALKLLEKIKGLN